MEGWHAMLCARIYRIHARNAVFFPFLHPTTPESLAVKALLMK